MFTAVNAGILGEQGIQGEGTLSFYFILLYNCFLCCLFYNQATSFHNLFLWNVVLGYNSLTSTLSWTQLFWQSRNGTAVLTTQSCLDNQNGIKILKVFLKV